MSATIASPIYYPSGDGQPVAETFDHLYVAEQLQAKARQFEAKIRRSEAKIRQLEEQLLAERSQFQAQIAALQQQLDRSRDGDRD